MSIMCNYILENKMPWYISAHIVESPINFQLSKDNRYILVIHFQSWIQSTSDKSNLLGGKKKRSTYPNFDLSDIKIRGIKTIGTIEKSSTYPKIRLIRVRLIRGWL